MTRRRTNIAISSAAVVVVLAALVGAFLAGGGRHDHPAATRARPHRAAPISLHRQEPPTVPPAGTPVQEEGDQLFAQSLGSSRGLAAVLRLAVPSPVVSGGWPSLPVAYAPVTWAEEFLRGLLDVSYAGQSRAALGAWLQAEEAPDLLPGVPAGAVDKVLYVSLLDPGIAGGRASPVPSRSRWATLAEAHAAERVSGLLVQEDPGWAQLVSGGWQPPDPRMTVLDISGLVMLRQHRVVRSQRFSCSVAVGSARWHGGYGTVAVGDWREG